MFTQKDLNNAKNLQRLLKKVKVELEGEEILAAAEMMVWTAHLVSKIEENLKLQEIQKRAAADAYDAQKAKEAEEARLQELEQSSTAESVKSKGKKFKKE